MGYHAHRDGFFSTEAPSKPVTLLLPNHRPNSSKQGHTMTKSYLTCLFSALIFCALPAHAESSFFWTAEIGRATLDLEDQYYLDEYESTPKALAGSGSIGYMFENRLLVGVGTAYAFSSVTLNTFDNNYDFFEFRAFTGYSWKLNDHLYLIPMIGVTDWSLDAEEAILFRSDDEEDSYETIDGTDVYGQLSIEIPLSERISLALSYTRTTTEVARVSATKLGVIGHF